MQAKKTRILFKNKTDGLILVKVAPSVRFKHITWEKQCNLLGRFRDGLLERKDTETVSNPVGYQSICQEEVKAFEVGGSCVAITMGIPERVPNSKKVEIFRP